MMHHMQGKEGKGSCWQLKTDSSLMEVECCALVVTNTECSCQPLKIVTLVPVWSGDSICLLVDGQRWEAQSPLESSILSVLVGLAYVLEEACMVWEAFKELSVAVGLDALDCFLIKEVLHFQGFSSWLATIKGCSVAVTIM